MRLEVRDRPRLGLHDRADQARLALALERLLAREHLVEHGAEREEIRPRVGFLAFHLLRRHVLHRADDRALCRHVQRVVCCVAAMPASGRRPLRQSEVEELRAALASA